MTIGWGKEGASGVVGRVIREKRDCVDHPPLYLRIILKGSDLACIPVVTLGSSGRQITC